MWTIVIPYIGYSVYKPIYNPLQSSHSIHFSSWFLKIFINYFPLEDSMGAKLSSFRRSSSKGKPYDSNITSAGSSIIELMKPDRLKTKKMMKKKQYSHSPEDKQIAKVREIITLEQLFMASPSRSFSYKRVHPSSSGVRTASQSFSMDKSVNHTALSCKARDSLSLEKRVRAEEEPVVSSIISRSESGNYSKKKVRFRLPEEADIIIFYSPAAGKSWSSSLINLLSCC